MSEPLAPRCAVIGCSVTIARGHLMCLEHWHMVPVPLRRQVKRAWAAFTKASVAEKLPALRDYREVKDAAINAVVRALP